MGFHKRWITEDMLMGHYQHNGIQGVVDLWRADAIITSDELSENVCDIVCSEYLTHEEILEQTEFLVVSAIINKWKNEKKKKTVTTG